MQDKYEFRELVVIFVGTLLAAICIIAIASHINSVKHLTPDEVCKKQFGEGHVKKAAGRYPSFCVDDSGIPKYPKTWDVKREI